jgi:hypothetical protein
MWPPEDKEPPEMMEARDREDQYRVSVEWLYDMDDYNEWMYEEDYEVRYSRIPNNYFKFN